MHRYTMHKVVEKLVLQDAHEFLQQSKAFIDFHCMKRINCIQNSPFS